MLTVIQSPAPEAFQPVGSAVSVMLPKPTVVLVVPTGIATLGVAPQVVAFTNAVLTAVATALGLENAPPPEPARQAVPFSVVVEPVPKNVVSLALTAADQIVAEAVLVFVVASAAGLPVFANARSPPDVSVRRVVPLPSAA